MKEHRFLVYEFGAGEAFSPIAEGEGFKIDDTEWKMAPAWKGNDQICCLVEKDSHLVEGKEIKGESPNVIIIIDTKGKLIRVLGEYPGK